MPSRRSRLGLKAVLCLVLLASSVSAAITPEQRAELDRFKADLQTAGKHYKAEEFSECAAIVRDLQTRLIDLTGTGEPQILNILRPQFGSLQRAHAMLELEGVPLEPLPKWEDLGKADAATMTPAPSDDGGVSFTKDIAPWLVSSCARCHIDANRGKFRMATFEELMKGSDAGVVIFAGDSKGSRLVDVIESGDMPRGGAKIAAKDLDALRKWIDAGAKFDGPLLQTPLKSLAALAGESSTTPDSDMAAKPVDIRVANGKETVSFSKDVAPILVANCNGCHFGGQRVMGGLNIGNFTNFNNGGDSGPVFVAFDPANSLIVKKIKGEGGGQRMPAGGRPALSAEQIDIISTWIKEGATYDGGSPTEEIEALSDKAWAESATHEEMLSRREQASAEKWKIVLPNTEPQSVRKDELLVMGNVDEAILNKVADIGSAQITQIRRQFKVTGNKPLVKGGMVLFVFDRRYDYGEFGRMIERRSLPAEWQGHWRSGVVDSYGVLSPEMSDKELTALVCQLLTGQYVGSLPEVPHWFAEGMARKITAALYAKDDPRIPIWDRSIPSVLSEIKDPAVLLNGKMDDEKAGVAGYALARFISARTQKVRYENLFKSLKSGTPFPQSMQACFATPDILIRMWLGLPAPKP